jgi:hypothetical protein
MGWIHQPPTNSTTYIHIERGQIPLVFRSDTHQKELHPARPQISLQCVQPSIQWK